MNHEGKRRAFLAATARNGLRVETAHGKSTLAAHIVGIELEGKEIPNLHWLQVGSHLGLEAMLDCPYRLAMLYDMR